jgi:putative ABC transport system substrate-binding protein
MRRGQFLLFLGSVPAWPLLARAEPSMRRVGVLALGNPNPEPFLKQLRDGLSTLGYIDGRDVKLIVRSAAGNASALSKAASELVELKVDVIVAWQTPAATAAKRMTSEIPIVMTAADPVGTGLVGSVSRPGGNLTGLDVFGAQLGGKCVELIRDAIPSARKVAILANTSDPFTSSLLAQIDKAADSVGIATIPIMRLPEDNFEMAFIEMQSDGADAVIVQPTLISAATIDLALKRQLPSFSFVRGLPAAGGLMAYAVNAAEQTHQLAGYVDRILKGSKPADMPIWQATRFELIINLKTARSLGLDIPTSLIARADEVIE